MTNALTFAASAVAGSLVVLIGVVAGRVASGTTRRRPR